MSETCWWSPRTRPQPRARRSSSSGAAHRRGPRIGADGLNADDEAAHLRFEQFLFQPEVYADAGFHARPDEHEEGDTQVL